MPNRAELETQLVNEIPQQANNFFDFIRSSPLMDVDIDLTRNKSLCRDIEL